MVFDWGGGTLDITLCQFLAGALVQVLSVGDTGVGGDQFDLRLLRLVKKRHEDMYPSLDWTRAQPTAEARLIQACEDAKIVLSTRDRSQVYVRDVLAVSGAGKDLEVEVSRRDLQDAVKDLVRRGLSKIQELLETADLPLNAIDSCLATGGMVAMPAIRDGLVEMFGLNRLHIPENSDTIVAEGSAWIGHDGIELRLAKPFEVLHANDCYVPLIHSMTALPTEGKQLETSFGMFCVDPRDGFAKLHFARPRWPGRESTVEPRVAYTSMTVKVDPYSNPLDERLDIRLGIDHNLIVRVRARSELRNDTVETEVHDLEFGLGFDGTMGEDLSGDVENDVKPRTRQERLHRAATSGAVRVRSNVTRNRSGWDLVPGEIVQLHRPDLPDDRLTEFQRHEKMYYRPCSICGRSIYEIERDGCDECATKGKALSRAAAQQRREERLRQGLPI